jgi:murein DD-endopeptidase MepM/ murein hydrolase activator NlpD
MTAHFIKNQHVEKRRSSSPSYKANYQSAVLGAGFMRQYKQKPAHTGRRKNAGRPHFSFFKFNKRPYDKPENSAAKTADRKIRRTRPETRGQEEQRKSGFSFPVPSPMTLAVMAGTVVISLLALNWDGFSHLTADYNSFRPVADENSAHHIINYADAGVSSILPVLRMPEEINAGNTEIEFDVGEIPLDLIETFKWSHYRVQKGDSVSKIAARFGISMDAVIASNEIRNARLLREGETLRIRNIDGIPHTVKKGDKHKKISKTYNVPLEIILDVNDIRTDTITEGEIFFIPGARMAPEALKLSLGELFIYPVRKIITSYYGWREDPFTGQQTFHSGIDLRGNTGAAVKAAMDGTVSVVGNSRVYGNYIILSHTGNYQTLYAHLSASSVKQGERVIQGNKIGEVGNTGLSTGSHLHFSVFKNGKAVNPLDLLN